MIRKEANQISVIRSRLFLNLKILRLSGSTERGGHRLIRIIRGVLRFMARKEF